MEDFKLKQTGQEVQEILDQVMPNKADIEAEQQARQEADAALQGQIDAINEEIGSGEPGSETINGRLDALEEAVGDGGSVDERIAAVVGDASEEYNTLGKIEAFVESNTEELAIHEDRIDALSAQNYVTVTANEFTTTVTDVLPETGSTDTVYRVGKWDGEQYDATVYAEYAWFDNAYVLLDVKEYGIDEVPTEGSENLVKSGGVYKDLYGVSYYVPVTLTLQEGKYYPTGSGATIINDTPSDRADTNCCVINCNAGQKFKINGKGTSTIKLYAFTYGNTNTILETNSGSVDYRDEGLVITAPEGTSKLFINFYQYDSTKDKLEQYVKVDGGIEGRVSSLESSTVKTSDIINDLSTGGSSKVLSAEQGKEINIQINGDISYSPITLTLTTGAYHGTKQSGTYMNPDTTAREGTSCAVMDVTYYQRFKVFGKSTSTIRIFAFTDSSNKILSSVTGQQNYRETGLELFAPYGATKLYINFLDYDSSTDRLDAGTIITEGVNQRLDKIDSEAVKQSDIVNDLTTGGADKVLSAEQGKELKEDLDEMATEEVPVYDLTFTQTTNNSGYKPIYLRAGITYDVVVELGGEYTGGWSKLNFYSSADSSALIYSGTSRNFSFTPDVDVKYYINAFVSVFSGSANVEIKISYKRSRYIKSSDTAKIQQEYDSQIEGLSLNMFGDILPASFKEKFLYGTDDLLIACQGDSITGLTQNCDAVEEPAHACPGGQYKSWVSMVQNQVSKVKPFYNRLDSVREDSDFFIKTGTWEQATIDTFGPEGDPTIPDHSKDSSVTALTYRSASNDASASFEFDTDNFDKCNIVFTKNKDAGGMGITIQEGDGKMLASIDRTTWVEANGFTHSQASETPTSTNGEAMCERHRRIWMKKVSGVTGTINITYARTANDGSYVYFWGTEMYQGRAILFDNIGRGGRTINLLGYNISDVFDRNPDLTILEMPLANDLNHNDTEAEIKAAYDIYFTGSDGRSYKQRSNNYEDFPIIVMLPHTRSSFFNESDNAIIGTVSVQTIRTAPGYQLYKMVYGYLYDTLKYYPNVSFVNMCDQMLNEAVYRFGGWKVGLSAGNLTADTTHPNQNGSNVYAKYLAAIFQ